jgi:hypothetical protein
MRQLNEMTDLGAMPRRRGASFGQESNSNNRWLEAFHEVITPVGVAKLRRYEID